MKPPFWKSRPRAGFDYLLVVMLSLAAVFVAALSRASREMEPVAYSELEKALADGRVERVVITDRQMSAYLNDLVKATDIARAIVTRYGMTEKLGLVAYEESPATFLDGARHAPAERRYSEATARDIDCAVRDVVTQAFSDATRLLARARRLLEKGAQELLARETLNESDLLALQRELGDLPGQQPDKPREATAA